MLDPDHLRAFVAESNWIEGIIRRPRRDEIEATAAFIQLDKVRTDDLQTFVTVCQPGAVLRDQAGLDVRVGGYVAPPGGPNIRPQLDEILKDARCFNPHDVHVRYEKLHPFTDGNGRSGRALWAWQMVRRGYRLELGFLHMWYYQTLERAG